MLKPAIAAIAAALFLLAFASIRYGLTAWWDKGALKRRLTSRQAKKAGFVFAGRRLVANALFDHVLDLMLALGWKMKPSSFFGCSASMGVAGVVCGTFVFHSFRSSAVLALLFGGLPYLMLRMSLVNRQMATRLDFLPAVELFYQSYLVTGSRHIRIALQKTVEERRLPGEVQAAFEQLYRNLSVNGDDEGSLRRFALSFGNAWADYFGNILKVALEEGNNVADNLKELIADMRKAQLANLVERHKLLEIRMANFAPILFLGLFLAVNFRLNPEGSYEYYVRDAGGRNMLLNAALLLFGSLLMGIYLSRRKL
ncbi:hypothetical protein ACFPPD_07745 [Cohnella suwonensis]|uniref:Type II secretion system protein GspF domain-containing protein n=1 Tax=Cohnella suwonensis TaxID=696072 RepID=A0ABW0LTH1_9BACL